MITAPVRAPVAYSVYSSCTVLLVALLSSVTSYVSVGTLLLLSDEMWVTLSE